MRIERHADFRDTQICLFSGKKFNAIKNLCAKGRIFILLSRYEKQGFFIYNEEPGLSSREK